MARADQGLGGGLQQVGLAPVGPDRDLRLTVHLDGPQGLEGPRRA